MIAKRVRPAVVLFDIDGTLLHAGGAGRSALDAALEATWGIENASAGISFAGATDPELIREILYMRLGLTASGVDDRMIKMVLAQYLSRLPEALAASTAFRVLPGARELVAQLSRRQGVTLALATGNVLPGARIKLAKAQLNRFFVSGAYGGDAPTRAGIVHTALTRVARRLNASLQLERCFLIGDTVKDVASALENRIVPIAVCTGTDDRTTLFAAGAHIVLDSLEQAQAVVRLL